MKPLLFLAIAVGVSVLGSLLVVVRHRKPSSPYGELDDFNHRMAALAPPDLGRVPDDAEPLEGRDG